MVSKCGDKVGEEKTDGQWLDTGGWFINTGARLVQGRAETKKWFCRERLRKDCFRPHPDAHLPHGSDRVFQ